MSSGSQHYSIYQHINTIHHTQSYSKPSASIFHSHSTPVSQHVFRQPIHLFRMHNHHWNSSSQATLRPYAGRPPTRLPRWEGGRCGWTYRTRILPELLPQWIASNSEEVGTKGGGMYKKSEEARLQAIASRFAERKREARDEQGDYEAGSAVGEDVVCLGKLARAEDSGSRREVSRWVIR